MIIIRPAMEADIEALYTLTQHSGIGITTLPKNKDLLHNRLAWSCASFNKRITEPQAEYYFFVAEDPDTHRIVGTCAIESRIGVETPFYSYKITHQSLRHYPLNIKTNCKLLNLVTDYQDCTEICTLFLDPAYRKNHYGALLSRSRFLFIAQFPERFAAKVIAEMRGISNREGHSPFWDQVGKPFFQLSFQEADSLTLASNKQFIADLMPKYPIYINLLAPDVQAVIGKTHQLTTAATAILEREGFHYNEYVDIFDAGPTLEAITANIASIVQSSLFTVKTLKASVEGPLYLLSTTQLNFRTILGRAQLNEHSNECILSYQSAELLHIQPGDTIRLSPLFLESSCN